MAKPSLDVLFQNALDATAALTSIRYQTGEGSRKRIMEEAFQKLYTAQAAWSAFRYGEDRQLSVQELIDELQKIENKSQLVCMDIERQDELRALVQMCEGDGEAEYILLCGPVEEEE